MKHLIILLIFIIGLNFMYWIFTANQFSIDAATFDAPLLPGNDNQYNLGYVGLPNQRWQNGFFSGNLLVNGNVGIGTTTPNEKLTVIDGNISQNIDNFIPLQVSITNTASLPYSIYVSGKYAYIVNNSSNSLQIFDVSNPINPQLVGATSTLANPIFVYVAGKYAYVVNQGDGYLQIFDVSNPNNPQLLGSGNPIMNARAVSVSGKYAYVVAIEDLIPKLKIYNISNPNQPALIGFANTDGGGRSIYISGRYAYIITDNNKLQSFDIANPAQPKLVNVINTQNGPRSLYVSGRYAYIVNFYSDSLQIFDISNPASLILINTITIADEPISLITAGRYVFIVHYDGKIFQIFDIINPLDIKIVGSASTNNEATFIFVSGRYAYILNTSNKLLIIDISGLEAVSANIHSLEADNLQVRNDIIAQGQLQVSGGINVGTGGIFSAGPIGISIASTTQTDAISAYFQGRVGIATTTPTQKLEVNGGIRLFTGDSRPACNANSTRGTLWFTTGASGIADTLEICNSSSTDGYVWRKLY